MTYDDGLVRLFLEGDEIGNGLAGSPFVVPEPSSWLLLLAGLGGLLFICRGDRRRKHRD